MKDREPKQRHPRSWFLPAPAILVLVAIGAVWSSHSRFTHSAGIQDKDMIGLFVAQTPAGRTTLALNKNHALRSALVEPDGYVLKQNTGWWKLIRQPDGQQQLEYNGIIQRCADGSVCVSGQGEGGTEAGMGVPIDKVDGKIIIYDDLGQFIKQ